MAQFEYHINILTKGTEADNNIYIKKKKRKRKKDLYEYGPALTAKTLSSLTLKENTPAQRLDRVSHLHTKHYSA